MDLRAPDDAAVVMSKSLDEVIVSDACVSGSFASRLHPALHCAAVPFPYRYNKFVNGFLVAERMSVKWQYRPECCKIRQTSGIYRSGIPSYCTITKHISRLNPRADGHRSPGRSGVFLQWIGLKCI